MQCAQYTIISPYIISKRVMSRERTGSTSMISGLRHGQCSSARYHFLTIPRHARPRNPALSTPTSAPLTAPHAPHTHPDPIPNGPPLAPHVPRFTCADVSSCAPGVPFGRHGLSFPQVTGGKAPRTRPGRRQAGFRRTRPRSAERRPHARGGGYNRVHMTCCS